MHCDARINDSASLQMQTIIDNLHITYYWLSNQDIDSIPCVLIFQYNSTGTF